MTDRLLPCPFCGSNAVFTPRQPESAQYDWERGRVECVLCDARTGGTLARELAIAAWNRRTDGTDAPIAEVS